MALIAILSGSSAAWALSSGCDAINRSISPALNENYTVPPGGGGGGSLGGVTFDAGDVVTMRLATTNGVTLSTLSLTVGTQSQNVTPAGNGDSITITALAGASGLAYSLGNASGAGTVTSTGSCLPASPATPIVTFVSPTAGPPAGGTNVTITGDNFFTATGVTFGGAPATSFSVVDNQTITAVTPAGVSGRVAVVVTNAGGTGTLANGYTYTTPGALPTITAIAGNQGSENGGESITIEGTNFTGATSVHFGTTPGTGLVVLDAQTIQVTTPSHVPGTVGVTVTTPTGAAVLPGSFTFYQVTSISLTHSDAPDPVTAGQTVTYTVTARNNGPLVANMSIRHQAPNGFAVESISGPVGANCGASGSDAACLGVTLAIGATATFSVVARVPVSQNSGAVSAFAIIGGSNIDGQFLIASTTVVALPRPTVTGIAPATGPTAGATPVTITGTNFTGATGVTIGGVAATNVVVVNDTTITATTGAHAAGASDVRVTIPAGSGTGTGLFTYVAPPVTVTSVTPNTGSTAGGTGVTIAGTGFTAATGVTFGGTAATGVTVVNDTTITATTPAGAAGAVNVAVTTAGGTGTGTNAFTYVVPQAALSLTMSDSPDPVLSGGTLTYTLVASNAGPGSTINAGVDTTLPARLTLVSATATSGTAVANVGTRNVRWSGALAAGGSVTITITATVNAGAPGVITNTAAATADNSATANASATTTINAPAPTVTGVAPTSGSTAGATAVTITGTNLIGATAVTFGGTAATAFTVVDDTTITATTPAHSAGAVNIAVTTSGGTGTGTGLFTYIAPPAAPTVTAVAPSSDVIAGGVSVTITGTNFTGATAVTFGGTAATAFTVVSATSITATAPAHAAGVVDIQVTAPGGTGTGSGLFTYIGPPTVTAVAPLSGTTAGGTPITITGTSFTGATAVTIGGTAATGVTVVNATTITATTPAHAAGAVDVSVTTPAGTGTGVGLYTFTLPAPTVTGVAPASGVVAGGTPVTITGTDFTGATAVTFGGVAATAITVVNATTITATTPAHTAGVVNVVVTTPSGSGTGTGLFTYVAAPTVTAVAPALGSTAGGTAITITGSGFGGATAVTIGGTAATAFTVVNATTITATTPAHAAGAADIAVTTAFGTGTGGGLFTYAVPGPVPTVTLVTPSSGPVNGGTAVTITGTGFTFVSAVTFGGTAAAFTVVDDTTITATTPAHASGPVDVAVTTLGGTGTGVGAFTFTGIPADSVKLRDTQVLLTTVAAQASGAAFGSATGSAVAEGFSDGGDLVSQNGDALRFNFAAEPRTRVDDAFAAIAGAQPGRIQPARSDWRVWAEVRGTGWSSSPATGNIRGGQVNAFIGVTRKFTPAMLAGIVAGYESLDYSAQTLGGRLRGGGWTFGGYVGWRILPTLRFDASLARAFLTYDLTANTAAASVPATRWIGSAGLTGSATWAKWQLEPSANLYVIWEKQAGYTDNLGTPQAQRDFSAGRASAGAKMTYPLQWLESVRLSPYLGLYGDYYFSSDTAVATGLASGAVLSGWSARATAGIGADLGGQSMSLGGELGGLGSEHLIWTMRGRWSVPF